MKIHTLIAWPGSDRAAITFLAIITLPSTGFSLGDEGHRTVGAVADKLIASSPNTVAHVRELLGTMTLEKAAVWADTVKRNLDPHDPEQVAFVNANPHLAGNSGPHDHHAYHYTDIPIQETRYRASSVGASKIDVVHMIRNCIAIIEGHSNASNNPTNIPPKTALKLLAHYVGDIHQPLHVGAAYFGPNATILNPNTDPSAQPDAGGNSVSFHSTKLHSYWDTPAVQNAMAAAHAATPRQWAAQMVSHPPSGWQTGGFISGWAVSWANEVLPIAREGHKRLKFRTAPHGWNATPAAGTTYASYDQWAAQQTSREISRSGYRLAAVLKHIWP